MMIPLLVVFLLLWVGIMVGFTRMQVQDAEQTLRTQLYQTQQQLAYYDQDILSNHGEDAPPVELTIELSNQSIDLFHLGGGAPSPLPSGGAH